MEQKNCWLKDQCSGIDCDGFCLKFEKLNELYNNSLLTDKQRIHVKLRVDSDNSDLVAFKRLAYIELNINEYINDGNNLFIHSQIAGNGKTSWAIRLAQSYLNKYWCNSKFDDVPVLFISVPQYLLAIKENISNKSNYIEHIKNNVLSANLVIWDDVGTKTATQFEHDNLFSIIDARLNAGKSNIFTSNLDGEDLHQALGDRLYSRIVNMSTDNIELVGTDKRNIANVGIIK